MYTNFGLETSCTSSLWKRSIQNYGGCSVQWGKSLVLDVSWGDLGLFSSVILLILHMFFIEYHHHHHLGFPSKKFSTSNIDITPHYESPNIFISSLFEWCYEFSNWKVWINSATTKNRILAWSFEGGAVDHF